MNSINFPLSGEIANASKHRFQTCKFDVSVPFMAHALSVVVTTVRVINEPRHEKTCLRGFRPGETQTGLLSYRSQLESWNFGYRNYRYYTIYAANNKVADHTARMCRLISAIRAIWSASLLFAHSIHKFSHNMAQILTAFTVTWEQSTAENRVKLHFILTYKIK